MFRIRKLDKFIAKQFLLLFAATFFICQFVLMMQFLWRYVDDLIGKGLTVDVLLEFLGYMSLMLVPQAIPLAILLSSLITFGNLGESSELTAIKAAGVSLMSAMRSLIVLVIITAGLSMYFQDVVGPEANKKFSQLLLSMKQKSPELEIPEGRFYDGLPNTNLYVQRKDIATGRLYGVMIYRQSGSYEDQAIILADSGMLQSTAEKKHLLMTLWSGEWFENMRSQDIGGTAEVPYRRETFGQKQILLDFDDGFNLADAAGIASNAKSKSSKQIVHDLDSIRQSNDSVGRTLYTEARHYVLYVEPLSHEDSVRLQTILQPIPADRGADASKADSEHSAPSQGGVRGWVSLDSAYAHLSGDARRNVAREAARQAQTAASDCAMKADYAGYLSRQERLHEIELIGKFTLALSCIVFFFIGAPLGAIIRKGGLGVPVIISVVVFIVYYIFDNSGMRMARDDNWTVWYGKTISMMVLTPLAVFFTYKANRDSTVFNIDAYRNFFVRLLGLRQKRNLAYKEVVISQPEYAADAEKLQAIIADIDSYRHEHRLLLWPNPIKVFFRPGDDRQIEAIDERLNYVIDDLSNTRDHRVLHELNNIPVIATKAHTRPFRRRWLNALTGLILPVGIFFYFRMIRFRLRLYRELASTEKACRSIISLTSPAA